MNRKWYYLKNEKAVGPVRWDKIIDLYKAGKIDSKSRVWCNQFSDWVSLNQVLQEKKAEESTSPPPLPNKKQQPPPIPDNIESPPPLPNKKTTEQDNKISVGPLQSKEDIIASQFITKVSFVVFSLLLMGSLYAFLSGGFQTSTNTSSDQIQINEQWPSAFDFGRSSSSFNPQHPFITEALVKDIVHTISFRMGQENTLNMISNRFPSLSTESKITEAKFNSEYKSAYDNIEGVLDNELPSWEDIKGEIRNNSIKYLDYSNVTREDAKDFLDKVENRASGNLESPVLETLLMFHPKYIESPRLLFTDDYTKEFRSKGMEKAKGVDLAIEYPSSWKAKDGRRPNVVRNFISDNGYGLDMVLIIIKSFPEEISGELSNDDILLLSGENIWEGFSSGLNTIEEGEVFIANRPAIWGEFSGSINRTGIELDMHGLGFAMIDGKNMIQLMYMSSQEKQKAKTKVINKFRHSAQIFQMMINSLDFFNKYEGPNTSLSNNELTLLKGKWSGVGYELNNDTSWKMDVSFSNEEVSVSYPSLDCSGKWNLIEVNGTEITFREKITTGITNCMDKGKVEISILSDKKINFKYYPQGSNELGARATLTKY
ncbi:DUF4339 domain-containing protein [Fodinibius sp. SL11]|uniref:DUF4339 domain-containing protein n=1 Tax=Fodinibius sp. SL11 TaxID=3425690 RepID=UPI003F880A1E